MNKIIRNMCLWASIVTIFRVTACKNDIDSEIEEMDYDRVLSVTDLDVSVSNSITAKISWDEVSNADYYILQFSNDSLEFNDIMLTDTVASYSDLPYHRDFDYDETYSVRVQALSNEGIEASKYVSAAFETDSENIFETLSSDSIGKTTVALDWTAGAEVDYFKIVSGKNDTTVRDISDAEAEAGHANITGLTYETTYTVYLYRNSSSKSRGKVSFTTLPMGTTLTADVDLNEAINTTYPNEDVFLLESGDYSEYVGTIEVNRDIKIQGLSTNSLAILHVQFILQDGVDTLEVEDIEMYGYNETDASSLDCTFQIDPDATSIGTLAVSGCIIHSYNKSLVSASSGSFEVRSISFDDCIVSDIYCSGADFIDFRASFPESIKLGNSTFSNCATANTRDFFRLDGNSNGNTFDDGSHTPTITVINNTFYNVMNSSSSTKRFFYVRWKNSDEKLISENNIFAEMGVSVYSNQSTTNMGTFDNNNYYNAQGYITSGNSVYDNSGSYTTLDPGFVNANSNDFTVTTQTLLNNEVGDPRWR